MKKGKETAGRGGKTSAQGLREETKQAFSKFAMHLSKFLSVHILSNSRFPLHSLGTSYSVNQYSLLDLFPNI